MCSRRNTAHPSPAFCPAARRKARGASEPHENMKSRWVDATQTHTGTWLIRTGHLSFQYEKCPCRDEKSPTKMKSRRHGEPQELCVCASMGWNESVRGCGCAARCRNDQSGCAEFEARNPKQIRDSKHETASGVRFSCFGFVSGFEIRISDLSVSCGCAAR